MLVSASRTWTPGRVDASTLPAFSARYLIVVIDAVFDQ
jgi:hypothetical protein